MNAALRIRRAVISVVPAALVAALASGALASQAIVPRSAPKTDRPQELVAPFFLAGSDYKAEIAIQNLRIDVPVTVRPSLLVGGSEVRLDPVTLSPKQKSHIDINAALASRGLKVSVGAVAVRYDFRVTGAIAATVQSEDENHHITLTALANGREEFMGTRLDAVVWAPRGINDGFVAIANGALEPRRVHVTYMFERQMKAIEHFDIAPRSVYVLNLESVLARSHSAGVGICLAFAGAPGDVQAEGAIIDRQRGFAKRVHFVDSTLHYNNASLRANFMLLGAQPSDSGFPAWIFFRSVGVVRNLSPTQSVEVTPVIKYTRSTPAASVRTIRLNNLILGPLESRIIDFSQAQGSGLIPREVHEAFVELNARARPGEATLAQEPHIVAELTSYDDQTLAYVVGPSFTAHPARGTTTEWRTDGSFDTVISIENIARDDDDVSITLISDSGMEYRRQLHMAPGALTRVSLKQWEAEGIADVNGRQIPDASGVVVIEGAHGTQSGLVFERLIHDDDSAYYVGPGSCDYITGIDGDVLGDEPPLQAVAECYWNTGGITYPSPDRLTTSDSSWVYISGNYVTFGDAGDGASAALDFYVDNVYGCGACSVMSYTAELPITSILTNYQKVQDLPPSFGYYNRCAPGNCLAVQFRCSLMDTATCSPYAQLHVIRVALPGGNALCTAIRGFTVASCQP
jgi:hypothetical protein